MLMNSISRADSSHRTLFEMGADMESCSGNKIFLATCPGDNFARTIDLYRYIFNR